MYKMGCMSACLSLCLFVLRKIFLHRSFFVQKPSKKNHECCVKNKMFCNSFVYGFEFTFLCFTYGCCHACSVLCVTLANLLKVYYVSCYP